MARTPGRSRSSCIKTKGRGEKAKETRQFKLHSARPRSRLQLLSICFLSGETTTRLRLVPFPADRYFGIGPSSASAYGCSETMQKQVNELTPRSLSVSCNAAQSKCLPLPASCWMEHLPAVSLLRAIFHLRLLPFATRLGLGSRTQGLSSDGLPSLLSLLVTARLFGQALFDCQSSVHRGVRIPVLPPSQGDRCSL